MCWAKENDCGLDTSGEYTFSSATSTVVLDGRKIDCNCENWGFVPLFILINISVVPLCVYCKRGIDLHVRCDNIGVVPLCRCGNIMVVSLLGI